MESAKEWMFKRFVGFKETYGETGHDDKWHVDCMDEYARELKDEIASLKKELAYYKDASESYKEQLKNNYMSDFQHINTEFMG